jgi:glycosyltransferase involved in cell wall biosynthesis
MKVLSKEQLTKKKITWITVDFFVDCDFHEEILVHLLREFEIHWIILLPAASSRFSPSDFGKLQKLNGLKIEFIYSIFRQRDPRRLLFYNKVYQKIRQINADVVYLNLVPDPYFLPFFWLLNKRKLIFCAHDGGVHKGFDFQFIHNVVFNLTFKRIRFGCMFSPSQANLFRKNFTKSKIYIIPLALKSFGESSLLRSDKEVVFLSFGVINYSKNIELLIEAACNIYEKGYKNFKVSLNGSCSNWEFYRSRIRHPGIFDCKIRLIENSEIPDLFSSAHYFVQPYRHVSQSGAMKVAFNYNLPVIASNYPGFADEINEGVNGYLFNAVETGALEELMIKVLENHQTSYSLLSRRMYNYTRSHYSHSILAGKYTEMFKAVMSESET